MKVVLSDKFQKDYERLNPEQKKAVDAIEGPVMVVAGPGTGKTSILTLRIANILRQTDTASDSILALTFTESGAHAMRRKLVDIVGTTGYKVNINTFHGFCNDIIKQYPERFPRIIGSAAITDVDQIAIMEQIILADTTLEALKPYGDPLFDVRPVLGEIRSLKREAIDVDDFEKSIHKQEKDFEAIPDKVHVKGAHKGKMKGDFIKLGEQIEKNKELHRLYRAYEDSLRTQKLYDFEDMIVEVVKTLRKDSDLLLILQETYQYILADEHQDANNAQNTILELLSHFHDEPNLFIVGDEKQAIFRFQGASLQNFLYFKKLYPHALLIHLESNYRSTQTILDASHALISNNILPDGEKRLPLRAAKTVGAGGAHVSESELIHVYEFSNTDIEHMFVALDIESQIKNGADPEEIAVLYRDNKDAFPIAQALGKRGLPFRIESDNDILKDVHIRKLLRIFEAVQDLASEDRLAKLLFVDFLANNFQIEPRDVYEILAERRADPRSPRKLSHLVKEHWSDLSAMLSSWATAAHNTPFLELFERIVRESGFLANALVSDASLERLATLEAFFTEVRRMAGAKKEYYLDDFMTHLERVREHGILTKTGKGIMKKGIRLMTAHRSKGLEFDYVYIVGVCDGHWGNKSRRTFFNTAVTPATTSAGASQGHIDDERRLFYVALTRAREGVTITYAKTESAGDGKDGGRERLPSQFIGEIGDSLKKVHDVDEIASIEKKLGSVTEHHFAAVPDAASSVSAQPLGHDVRDRDYLRQLFMDQGLSVTALNNYLRCPWEYFFVNLIRLPKAQNKHQMYGTAVHGTLETFFNKYREDEDMSKAELLALFESNLAKMPLSGADFEPTLEKGKRALGGYFEAYKGQWPRALITEYSIRGVHFPIDTINILLTGKLDKIELGNDRDVNVVDYKTGPPRSRNEIEGKTKNADGNYKRQLVFYRLLLDSMDDNRQDKKQDKKYRMISGELDFIEPNEQGIYKKEKFDVRDEDVAELRQTIERVAREILDLTFFNYSAQAVKGGCGEKDCEYCELAQYIR